jgi:DNA-binding CsgD family transcriptional regulator
VGPLIFPTCVATPRPDRHNQVMGRKRSEQTFPDLFSTDAVRDASTPPPPATKDATAQPEPQRHVLPKNLRTTVKHLNDEELDLLHAATLEEIRRRGRLQQNVGTDSAQTPRHAKRSPIKDKISQRRRVDIAETTLTLGQINAVRAAFRAGITPARIARQFGISQSNVRKALATDELKG